MGERNKRRKEQRKGNMSEINTNKKFLGELIAYFPLKRHGPHRKQNN
jgi:hypothetical protein